MSIRLAAGCYFLKLFVRHFLFLHVQNNDCVTRSFHLCLSMKIRFPELFCQRSKGLATFAVLHWWGPFSASKVSTLINRSLWKQVPHVMFTYSDNQIERISSSSLTIVIWWVRVNSNKQCSCEYILLLYTVPLILS